MQTLSITQIFLYTTSAAMLTVALVLLLRPIAIQLGLVDIPGGRKQHKGAIPLVGGPAMGLGFVLPYISAYGIAAQTISLAGAATLLVCTGIIDDYRDIRAKIKLRLQILAAILVTTYGGFVIHDLGGIFIAPSIQLGLIAIPFTVFAIVGVVNALNLSDGVDGLGGSLALVTAISLLGFALAGDSTEPVLTLSILCTVIVAFLFFNFPLPNGRRASIFMGDSGSMFLGFVLACALVHYSQGPDKLVRPVTCLWLFALPLFDTVSVMSWRILKGRSPFSAGREHLHHIIEHAGYKGFKCTLAMVSIASAYALIGVGCEIFQVSENIVFTTFIMFFAAHFWVIKRAWKITKLIKSVVEETPLYASPSEPKEFSELKISS